MTEIDKHLRDWFLIQTQLTNVLDDADDFDSCCSEAVDVFSDGVLAKKAAPRDGTVNQHHRRLSCPVVVAEPTARDQVDAQTRSGNRG